MLNSEDPEVRRLAAVELEVQAELMDGMGLGQESVVVLHVGGAAGGIAAGLERFERGFERSRTRRARVSSWRTTTARTGSATCCASARGSRGRSSGTRCITTATIPTRSPSREALELALATWPAGVTPKIHYSTPKTAVEERKRRIGRRVERTVVLPQLRAHADLIDPIAFEQFLAQPAAGLDFDVMLEAKAKDLALLRLREQLRARGR